MNNPPTWLAGAVLALVLLATVAAPANAQFPFQPAPASPQPGPQPAPQPAPAPVGDQRAAQIRSAMEQAGLRVLGVEYKPSEGNNPPGWLVLTAANYAQPAWGSIFNQAGMMWGATFRVISRETPETVMFTGQQWSKHLLILVTQLKYFGTFLNDYNAAGNDERKQGLAVEAFLKTVNFRVYDLERQQFVDQKDFVNKNFTR